MTIPRDALETGRVDLSDVLSGERLAPVHPGTVLRDDFLEPLGLSVYELAKELNVPRSRANDIVRGQRAVTTDTALRLARYFGTSAEFWMTLQARHDLDVAARALRPRIEREVTPRAA